MGYSQAQKAETHRRIVEIASRRFLEVGIDGIGVADLMKEAGVTVGGFYKHFRSREDLVLQAVEHSVKQIEDRQAKARSLLDFVDFYLSEFHRDNPGFGCALGALSGDVARGTEAVRTLYTSRVEHTLAFIESFVLVLNPDERRARALLVLSSCVGAIGLSRAVADPSVSKRILDSTQEQIVALLPPASERPQGS